MFFRIPSKFLYLKCIDPPYISRQQNILCTNSSTMHLYHHARYRSHKRYQIETGNGPVLEIGFSPKASVINGWLRSDYCLDKKYRLKCFSPAVVRCYLSDLFMFMCVEWSSENMVQHSIQKYSPRFTKSREISLLCRFAPASHHLQQPGTKTKLKLTFFHNHKMHINQQ